MAPDIIESKIFKRLTAQVKRKAPTNICKVFFLKKGVELIVKFCILRDLSAKACLPSKILLLSTRLLIQ